MKWLPVLGIVCALAFVWATLLGVADDALAAPTVDELVANVSRATGARPAVMGFRQYVTLRALLFEWKFYADVAQRGDRVELTVHDAPAFLDDDISVSLLDVSEGLEKYDLRFVEETRVNGELFYVLEGEPRAAGGVQRGRVWVNARNWLVERAELEYPWGKLSLEQRFETVDGYVVLAEQHASVNRLGARLTVRYGDYWFAGQE